MTCSPACWSGPGVLSDRLRLDLDRPREARADANRAGMRAQGPNARRGRLSSPRRSEEEDDERLAGPGEAVLQPEQVAEFGHPDPLCRQEAEQDPSV